MDWNIILKVLGPSVLFIAIFMEAYKKNIRSDKAKDWENWLLAGILSVTFAVVGYLSYDLPGKPIAILYYSFGIFAVQLIVDMKIVKAVVRIWLKKQGLTEDEVEEITDVDNDDMESD
jgi:ABC-type nitrate/sulfonate/bicarbonate transport system substrate-binding protein